MPPSKTEDDESRTRAVLYARVSSKEQEQDGFSIPAQVKLLKGYARSKGLLIVEQYIDLETARHTGRTRFSDMLKFFKREASACRVWLRRQDSTMREQIPRSGIFHALRRSAAQSYKGRSPARVPAARAEGAYSKRHPYWGVAF